MYKITFLIVVALMGLSATANAQYSDERRSGPLLGGAGDYVYPVICYGCKVWQDYRNFAWNQLDLHGGYAHTPTRANDVTTFLMYTNRSKDLYPTVVEVTPEAVDVHLMNSKVGRATVRPKHFVVHTHPENGDRVRINVYPKRMRKLVFPYKPPRFENSPIPRDQNWQTRRGGGDSSGGSGARSSRGGIGGTGIGGWSFGSSGGNFCGIGTDYICIQF